MTHLSRLPDTGKNFVAVLFLSAVLMACSDSGDTTTQAIDPAPAQSSSNAGNLHLNSKGRAIEIIDALFEGAITRSGILAEKIQLFTRNPSRESFETAQLAWNDAHQAYNEAQIFRLFGLRHPLLDLNDGGQEFHSITSRIDSFPLLPGYLDSVEGYPLSGLVHSELPISIDTLIQEHHFSDEAYVTLGFHALHFILTGDTKLTTDSWARFELNGDEAAVRAAQRRISYLDLLGQQIHEDIKREAGQWLNDDGFYRATFKAMSNEPFEEIATELQNPSTLDDYLNSRSEHLSSAEAEAIRVAWKALAEAVSPAAKPAQTAPLDN